MTQSDVTAQLAPKYQRFITAMLSASNLTDACRQCGISDDTGRRWLAIEGVKEAIDQASTDLFNQDLGRLKRMVGPALDTLQAALSSEIEPSPARIRAAAILLEKSIEIDKVQQLERRIAELEALNEKGNNSNAIRRIK